MIPLRYDPLPEPAISNSLQYYYTRRITGELQLHIKGKGSIGRPFPFDQYRTEVVDLFIEENVVSIPRSAFTELISLEYVELPASLREIGKFAFDGCSKLQEVKYNGSLQSWVAMRGDLALPDHFPRPEPAPEIKDNPSRKRIHDLAR